MSRPKAYSPEHGYKYQILSRYNNEAYEHCDYAKDRKELLHLLENYRQAYGTGFSFNTILLPQKYWNKA